MWQCEWLWRRRRARTTTAVAGSCDPSLWYVSMHKSEGTAVGLQPLWGLCLCELRTDWATSLLSFVLHLPPSGLGALAHEGAGLLTGIASVFPFSCIGSSFLSYILSTGDFSMLHWVCGLTGGSDHGRCPFSVGCLLSQYPYPRYHTGTKQTRDMNAVSGQWELAVLNVANWAAGHGGACTFHEGEAFVSCPVCGRDVPYSSEVFKGSGVLYCRDPAC